MSTGPTQEQEAQESAGHCGMLPGLSDADALDAVRPVSGERVAVRAPDASVPPNSSPEQALAKSINCLGDHVSGIRHFPASNRLRKFGSSRTLEMLWKQAPGVRSSGPASGCGSGGLQT